MTDATACHIAAESPRLNRRQAAKQATRVRVLTAARTLFEAGGYAEATIRAIARTMGMSTGAIFANFEGKAELWTAVFGGPAPDAAIADEIARTLGALPDHVWSLTHHAGRFQAVLTRPASVTDRGAAHPLAVGPFVATAATPAEALRAAREAALQADRRCAA